MDAKPRIYRQYSDVEKAHALAAVEANGGNVALTAKELGIPQDTMYSWHYGHVHPDVVKLQKEQKLPIADRLESLVHQIMDGVPDKIAEASLQQSMTSVAIAVDKMRLLRGEPTSIQQKTSSDDSLFQQIQRLRQRIVPVDTPANSASLSRAEGTSGESAEPVGTGIESGGAAELPLLSSTLGDA